MISILVTLLLVALLIVIVYLATAPDSRNARRHRRRPVPAMTALTVWFAFLGGR